MITIEQRDINEYYPLICKDGKKYFYIDFDNNVPNCTIYDTQFMKNRKLDLFKLFGELKSIFEVYPYQLKEFYISLKFKDKREKYTLNDVIDEYEKYHPLWDRKRMLLKFLEQYLFLEPEVKTCNITLLKPVKYQNLWEPDIPFVHHNEMPRTAEIIFVNNVKRKIPKPKSFKQKQNDSLKFNGTTQQHILSRDEGICQHCGADTIKTPDIKAHIDHIIPKSKGGPGEPWNGQVLCSTCNAQKHNNGNLNMDKEKLLKLQKHYNIVGELKKVKGRWDYYNDDGEIVGRFSRNEIKKMG